MTIRMLVVALAVAGAAVGLAPLATAAPYKNCSQAKANGDYNIPESSDKYGPWLDRDGDGIGCEG
ncbi:excalibur calcium-binding domain-containing protein [Mycolicibacterium porcinum]|uniref:excalibur calcium-binding domain-containing protein n=1 Tax=Mycobacteriaceae TaxID=1762 RepID=UPI0031F9DDD0